MLPKVDTINPQYKKGGGNKKIYLGDSKTINAKSGPGLDSINYSRERDSQV